MSVTERTDYFLTSLQPFMMTLSQSLLRCLTYFGKPQRQRLRLQLNLSLSVDVT